MLWSKRSSQDQRGAANPSHPPQHGATARPAHSPAPCSCPPEPAHQQSECLCLCLSSLSFWAPWIEKHMVRLGFTSDWFIPSQGHWKRNFCLEPPSDCPLSQASTRAASFCPKLSHPYPRAHFVDTFGTARRNLPSQKRMLLSFRKKEGELVPCIQQRPPWCRAKSTQPQKGVSPAAQTIVLGKCQRETCNISLHGCKVGASETWGEECWHRLALTPCGLCQWGDACF